MNSEKKELLKFMVILYLLGVAFILFQVWNVKQYDKAHPYQKYINIQTEQ